MIDFHIHHRSDNRWRGCGAALLSCNPPVIVTAAHCLQGVDDPSKLRVIIIITVIVTIVIITTNPWKWKRLFWCLLWRIVRPGTPVGANSMMSDTTSLAGLAVEEKLLSHFGIWVYKNQPPAFGLEPGWIMMPKFTRSAVEAPTSPSPIQPHQTLARRGFRLISRENQQNYDQLEQKTSWSFGCWWWYLLNVDLLQCQIFYHLPVVGEGYCSASRLQVFSSSEDPSFPNFKIFCPNLGIPQWASVRRVWKCTGNKNKNSEEKIFMNHSRFIHDIAVLKVSTELPCTRSPFAN